MRPFLKFLGAFLILVWLYLGWHALQPFRFRKIGSSYKMTMEEGSKVIYETPWSPVEWSTEQEERSFWLKAKLVMCCLLALDTLGIVYVVRRLRVRTG